MSSLIIKNVPNLPAMPSAVLPALDEITRVFGIPRDVLASSEEIQYAWNDLPRELQNIPENLRGELIARMCVAVSAGLFDGAINYIWNAAILQLREKIQRFGLSVVAQIQQSDFEEKHLLDLQDSKLLELCLKLNIINEDGFFFLDQCREVRNNFSAAHPTLGKVNDREFVVFLNRCVKYALGEDSSPRGVDISAFISVIKGNRFNQDQCSIWVTRLSETYEAQRLMLITMVHGIYCDPNTAESSRLNAIDLCEKLKPVFTSAIKSDLINKHSEYIAKGDGGKHTASTQFFENLGLLTLLNETELHAIYSRAVERLWNVHNGINNFYNEPPFAERLLELSQQSAIPETVQDAFVLTVACCRVGNGYGVSNAAVVSYNKIISSLSPREIASLIKLATLKDNKLGQRLSSGSSYRTNFKALLSLIDPLSVPNVVKADYDKLSK